MRVLGLEKVDTVVMAENILEIFAKTGEKTDQQNFLSKRQIWCDQNCGTCSNQLKKPPLTPRFRFSHERRKYSSAYGLTTKNKMKFPVSYVVAVLPLAVFSSPTLFRECNGAIRHVHLAVGKDASSSMTVSFSSITSKNGKWARGGVLVGRHPDKLTQLVIEEEEPSYHVSLQPRDWGNYTSPLQHHVTITGLNPRTKYYYQCVTRPTFEELLELQYSVEREEQSVEDIAQDILYNAEEQERDEASEDEHAQRRSIRDRVLGEASLLRRRLAPPPYDSRQCACPDPSKIRSFSTMARPGHGYPKLAVIGDIGQFPHSEETLEHLRLNHNGVDAILLAGDIAYPELDSRRWDTFMDFLDDYPLVENIPMHITPGNHDIQKPEFSTQIFAAYETRFRMPRIQEAQLGTYAESVGKLNMDRPPYPLDYEYGNAYYGFQYGRMHQIFINSYSSLEPGSKQYEWLVQELEQVDRTQTPWLIVTYHVPIYNTFDVHQHDYQMFATREHIEPLLVKYRVNIVFNGHIHAYLRTKPVAFGNVTATAPIHIVMGAGGRDAKAAFLNDEPEEWVEVRDATIYGYGLLEVCNDTHARWDWVHTGEGSDHNIVANEDVVLPPGGVDHTFFYNQYYLED